jgi:hypothetical protein
MAISIASTNVASSALDRSVRHRGEALGIRVIAGTMIAVLSAACV